MTATISILHPSCYTKAREIFNLFFMRRKSMYTVKEVAKMLDLSEHAIRYYTDKD
ncbi:hypothetical protein JCM19039_356 [Geomicrobium sp. JCM 19039]|nr:hypothetical protein JCM19039_356 [Geomicrobium sp. JCM 19039]